jgi:pimeloyl-ACP methyl ester carboxylesterase
LETISISGLTVLRALPAGERRRDVLFVHGYFADATIWEGWLARFAAQGFAAYAVNLRGRSASRPGTALGGVSVAEFADDAAVVARSLGMPAVVGHSMGGLIAQRLAADGLVSAAVLITPAPPRGIPLFVPALAAKQIKYVPALLLSRVMHPDREDLRDMVMNRVPPDRQEYFLNRLIPDSGRAGREMSITGVGVDRARIHCPIAVYAASDDRFIPPRIVKRVARRYGVEAHVLQGHGHMVIVEPGWEQLADEIARSLHA